MEEGVEDDYSIIQRDQMFPDNAVKREMSKLPVRCFSPGCSWTGNFRAFEEHNRVCPKFLMKCNACGKTKIPRDQWQRHIADECQNQKVSCPAGCGWFQRSRLQEHSNSSLPSHILWMMQEIDGLKTQIQHIAQVSQGQQVQERCTEMTVLEKQVVDIMNHSLTVGQSTKANTVQTEFVDEKLALQSEHYRTLDANLGKFEVTVATLHREIDQIISALERNEHHKEEQRRNGEEAKRKILSLERTLTLKDIALAEQDLRTQLLESASYEGSLVWKIANFSQKQKEASRGKSISIYSPAFYTSRLGYKLYPNGDGMGKGTHVSLFFVVMRGHYDPLLPWPFKQRVTFMLVNQLGGDHVLDSFRPDPSSSSFRRPTSDMNIASGSPLFISLAAVQDPSNGYLKDNTMYIKISVDTSNLREPLINDERINTTQ